MEHPASRIARDLAGQAERLCRHYLSNGRREGSYWLVGDVHNTPGRSLFVRLRDAPDGGRRGKWSDAQSGEHGDLLDIIRANTVSGAMSEALTEARRFLSLPDEGVAMKEAGSHRTSPGSPGAARRLLAMTRPITGSLAERYLAERSIPSIAGMEAIRFHPHCWYRRSVDDIGRVPRAMPAMVSAVTDLSGAIVGAHRTWLSADGSDKAAVANPRRSMGHLLGHGVRFGRAARVMAAGEGIETMLSCRVALPALPAIAGLSAAHLAAIRFPASLECLYVARDDDPAGQQAFAALARRATEADVELLPLDSHHGDLNADLRILGPEALARSLSAQMRAEHRG